MYKDQEPEETTAHEDGEPKRFERKEDAGKVKGSADKKAMRKNAMRKMLGAM
jgi:hypothetical protein